MTITALKRNVRRGRLSPADALHAVKKTASPKLIAWLQGRIAWDAGRKRNDSPCGSYFARKVRR